MANKDNGAAYDRILSHIGEFGPYQKRILLLTILSTVGEGVHTLITIFSMGVPEFRCAVPGLTNDTFLIQNDAHAQMVNTTIPLDLDKGGYSQCSQMRVPQSPGANLTSPETERCSRWVYSTEVFASSIIADFDLVCDREIYVSHCNMMTMAGLMIGSLISGPVSDLVGRKKSFLLFYWLHLVVSIFAGFVTSVPALLFSRIAVAGCGLAFYMSAYVLCMELVSPRKRALAGTSCVYGWASGMLILLIAAFFIRHWRTLHLVTAVPMVVPAIAFFWLFPESPRWLMNKGRYSEAQAILSNMAKVNKRTIPEKLLLSIGNNESVDSKASDVVSDEDSKPKNAWNSLLLLMKSPVLMVRMAILFYCWSVNSMVYYGLTLNVGSIFEGDIYLNFAILVILEFISYLIIPPAVSRIGRKYFFCGLIFVGGSACIAIVIPMLMNIASPVPSIILSNLGKFFITTAFATIWLYTSELLPTPIRQSCIGSCSFVGRLDGMASPYIAMIHTVVGGPLGKALPLVIFGAAAIIEGVLGLLLPETINRRLPETAKEAENMKKYRQKTKEIPSETDTEAAHTML